MKFNSIIIFLFLLFSCNSLNEDHNSEIELGQDNLSNLYSIKKFVDGDTFWINDGSSTGLKIRLIGVDTPENKARFGKPKEYFGAEASAFTKKMLLGKKVRLECDIDEFDSFGRTLAYVYLEDGTFLNEELIKQGFATIMTVQPNSKYADHFYKLQVEARENKRGLWKNSLK